MRGFVHTCQLKHQYLKVKYLEMAPGKSSQMLGSRLKHSPLRMEDVKGPVSYHKFAQKPDGFENHIWVKKKYKSKA